MTFKILRYTAKCKFRDENDSVFQRNQPPWLPVSLIPAYLSTFQRHISSFQDSGIYKIYAFDFHLYDYNLLWSSWLFWTWIYIKICEVTSFRDQLLCTKRDPLLGLVRWPRFVLRNTSIVNSFWEGYFQSLKHQLASPMFICIDCTGREWHL